MQKYPYKAVLVSIQRKKKRNNRILNFTQKTFCVTPYDTTALTIRKNLKKVMPINITFHSHIVQRNN